MDREDGDALLRRMQEEAAKSGQSQDSSEEDDTQAVREGTTRAIDADDLSTMRRERGLTEGDAFTQAERAGGFEADPALAKPGDLPESIDVTKVGPDGVVISDRTLTSPTGEAIGGGRLPETIQSRAGALGGDTLGRDIEMDPAAGSSDRDLGRTLSQHDGSMVSAAPVDPVTGMQTGRDRDLDPPEPPTGRHEDPSYDGEHEHAPPMTGRDQDPTDDEQGDDIVGPGYAQPDPDSGYDVVTGESVAAAVKEHAGGGDPGIYRPTEDGGAVEGNAINLADNDPQIITNYGPDGPQTVEVGADWAPPVDTLFDPPPEGGSAGMAGAHSAMADPGAALGGGGSVIGSSTPDEAPPPPDPPPGEDPDGGPLGPPGGGGGEG